MKRLFKHLSVLPLLWSSMSFAQDFLNEEDFGTHGTVYEITNDIRERAKPILLGDSTAPDGFASGLYIRVDDYYKCLWSVDNSEANRHVFENDRNCQRGEVGYMVISNESHDYKDSFWAHRALSLVDQHGLLARGNWSIEVIKMHNDDDNQPNGFMGSSIIKGKSPDSFKFPVPSVGETFEYILRFEGKEYGLGSISIVFPGC